MVQSQPQAAYSVYTHGLYAKWTYLSRAVPDLSSPLFLRKRHPSKTNSSNNRTWHTESKLKGFNGSISLSWVPIGLSNLSLSSDNNYKTSILMSAPFIDLIVAWSKSTFKKAWSQQQQIKLEVRKDILQAKSDALLIYISNYQQFYNIL